MSTATSELERRTVSVVLVEDERHVREAFVSALRSAPEIHVLGAVSDLPEARRLLDEGQPDVLLIDIVLPSGSGIELIRHARRHHPGCEVMVVTMLIDEQVVLRCIEAGATGYLLKQLSGSELVDQVRLLARGGSPITPSIARLVLGRLCPLLAAAGVTHDRPASDVSLSKQERMVLQLCAKGYSYEEIGRLLDLSRHTVETYVKRLYRKLHVHSKTEAVYEGRRLGLVAD